MVWGSYSRSKDLLQKETVSFDADQWSSEPNDIVNLWQHGWIPIDDGVTHKSDTIQFIAKGVQFVDLLVPSTRWSLHHVCIHLSQWLFDLQ
jgi:hypothetical protein